MSFDGVNDYVLVPDSNALDATTAVTVEAWIKRSKSGALQVVVGKPGNGQSRLENYALWLNTSNEVVAYFGNGSSFVSVAAPLDTNWHHVAATYDNATAKLYVDGALSSQASSSIQHDRQRAAAEHGSAERRPLLLRRPPRRGGGVRLRPLGGPHPGPLRGRSRDRQRDSGGHARHSGPRKRRAELDADVRRHRWRRAGDSATVTVRVYAGNDALGTPVQTLSATRVGVSYSVDASSALASGVYTAQAEQLDGGGNRGRSSANTFSVDAPAPSTDRVLVGAGDIADCGDRATAQTGRAARPVPQRRRGHVRRQRLPVGNGAAVHQLLPPDVGLGAERRTRPSVGSHDYGDQQGGSLAGYTGYFANSLALLGPSASDPSRAYYSYDIGAWHVAVLNSECFYYAPNCSEPGQEQWLRADLASRPAACTLLYFHSPLFTSGSVHSGEPRMLRYWNAALRRRRRHHPQRPQPPVRAVRAADADRRGRPGVRHPPVRGRHRRRRASTASGRSGRTARFATPAPTGSSSWPCGREATTGSSSRSRAGPSPTRGVEAATEPLEDRLLRHHPRLRRLPPPPPPPPPPSRLRLLLRHLRHRHRRLRRLHHHRLRRLRLP